MNWKHGLPPGNLTNAMLRDFEVYFSPAGMIHHRERTEEEKRAYDAAKDWQHSRFAAEQEGK